MMRRKLMLTACAAAIMPLILGSHETSPERREITILYDAFGPKSELKKDWGFAALIEYRGKRILFDTGNNAAIFKHNVEKLGIDLRTLDAVVISHRHGDHTTGISHVLSVNPEVKIFTPLDVGLFRFVLPRSFLEPAPVLPPELRYFDGETPGVFETGNPWEGANFVTVREATEIMPGFLLVPTRSQKPGTIEMNELSLVIRTDRGQVVVVGCSHSGVERILQDVANNNSDIHFVVGGFHLVGTPESEIRQIADLLHDEFRVERVAPGHCTSELGFSVFLERFGERFHVAGLGSVLQLP